MATYSTNLALTLINTGDQAGTWGVTTNTNLGTLLEQAISGYVTQAITDGADTTITIPNGSTGVARNMYIECTGTLTANRNLVVPANKKLYFIYNNTSGGFAVTVKVSGQTGVSVPNGEKKLLVSNGTDIVEAITPEVTSPASTTDNAIVRWDGTDGSAIQNSSVTISDSGVLTTPTNAIIDTLYIGKTRPGGGPSSLNNIYIGETLPTFSTTANANVIIGQDACASREGGSFATYVGWGAGGSLSTAISGTISFNTAIGASAMAGYRGGSSVAVGYGALGSSSTVSASANVAVGFDALEAINNGQSNTAVGTNAYKTGDYTNSACFGANTAVTGNDQVQLGDSSTTTYAYGAVQDRSDARDKTDIQDTQLGLNFIMALRPRDYRWDYREDYRPPAPPIGASKEEKKAWRESVKLANLSHDGTHKRTRLHHGLVAQEVKATIDSLGIDFGGYQDHSIKGGDDVLSIGYNELIGPLIKAIQELKAEFDEYKANHP